MILDVGKNFDKANKKVFDLKIQVLVTTMNATDFSLITAMNLQTDTIIANQMDDCNYAKQDFCGGLCEAIMVSTNTRGLSLNRNIALAYADADADVIVFADDDQVFVNGYKSIIEESFMDHPEADAIKFYCKSTNDLRPLSFPRPSKFQKAKLQTVLSSGVVGLAVKLKKIRKYDITFPNSIGAGTYYSSGEDSVFIKELLDHNIGLYLSTCLISYVKQENSSWFSGYNEHFFITTGYVYAKLYRRLAIAAAIRRAYKMKKKINKSFTFKQMIMLMNQGIREFEEL